MSIVGLILILIIIGVCLYLINTVVPMDAKIKTIINVVVLIATLLWLAELFGLFDMGGHIGRIH
jgi:hypothetical protein